MTEYLSAVDVEALHGLDLERYSGLAGLRDRGALESAVVRPQMAVHYGDADIAEQATILIAGIALGHAFVDGKSGQRCWQGPAS